MPATATATQIAAPATTEVVEHNPKAHRELIVTAPKDRKIVAWHPTHNVDVVLEFDATWGNGRGAWFDSKNRVVNPKFWNPLQTGLYNL